MNKPLHKACFTSVACATENGCILFQAGTEQPAHFPVDCGAMWNTEGRC